MSFHGVLGDPSSPTLGSMNLQGRDGVPALVPALVEADELPHAAIPIHVTSDGKKSEVGLRTHSHAQCQSTAGGPDTRFHLEECESEGDVALPITVPSSFVHVPMVTEDKQAGADLSRAHTEYECGDLMLKLLMLSRHFPSIHHMQQSNPSSMLTCDGREVCDMYNSLIANIAYNCNEPLSRDCADTFRSALQLSHAILEHAVYNPVEYHDGLEMSDKDVHRLDICMVDALRTCCFIGSSTIHSPTQREYSNVSRSTEGQLESKMCDFMRSGRLDDQKAYATADKMFENFHGGLSNLKELMLKTDNELIDFLENGKEHMQLFLICFMFPTIFDGNRMRCANAIAARFYGPADEAPHEAFGSSEQVAAVFNSNSNMVSMNRIVYTVCAILSMAKLSLWLASSETIANGVHARALSQSEAVSKSSGKRASESEVNRAIQAEACKHPQWKQAATMYGDIIDLANKKMCGGGRPDAPGANADIMDYLATWFEESARCADKFSLLANAFTHDAFCIDKPSKIVRNRWREFRIANNLKDNTNVSLWLASQFLVSCRLELHDVSVGGSNILTAACIVFSGSISRMVDIQDGNDPSVRGPFKFAPHVQNSIAKMFNLFHSPIAKRVPSLPREATVTRDKKSKVCKATKITHRILKQGCVRSTHEKSKLVDSRLSACMFMLSVKEMLMADVDPGLKQLPQVKLGVTASLHEGRKDLRRMYIIALQTLPCLKYARCRNMNVTHLIEQNRKMPQNKRTTGDNVEKPWRDIVGGMLISTILYPAAGRAFFISLCRLPDRHPMPCDAELEAEDGDDEDTEDLKAEKRLIQENSFVCHTHEAVNVFIECFKTTLSRLYPLNETLLMTSGPVRDGMSHARMITGQQISFTLSFLKCIEDCGPLWEFLQLTFGIQNKSVSNRDFKDKVEEEDAEDAAYKPPPCPLQQQVDDDGDDEWEPVPPRG